LLEKLFTESKSSDFLKLRKKIVIIKPMQNSRPARANKKKDVDVNTKSSFIVPIIATYEYKITQIISEYIIIVTKFLELIKNIEVDSQNSKTKKLTQVNTNTK